MSALTGTNIYICIPIEQLVHTPSLLLLYLLTERFQPLALKGGRESFLVD